MSVEFEEDNGGMPGQRYQSRVIIGQPAVPSMSNFFVKVGIVKNNSQAYKLMIFLVLLCVVLAIVVYYVFVVNAGHPPVPASAIYETNS